MRSQLIFSHLKLHFIVLIYGFTAILGKLISISAVDLVWYRMLIAAISLFIFLKFRRISLKLPGRDMLKIILYPDARYRIYLDYKDTQGATKVKKLQEVLCNNMYDFSRRIIERVQLVRSHEVEILQLADLLIGTVSYVNRGLSTSTAKRRLVDRMRARSGYKLTQTTLLRENKVNLFRWHASEVRG